MGGQYSKAWASGILRWRAGVEINLNRRPNSGDKQSQFATEWRVNFWIVTAKARCCSEGTIFFSKQEQ